MVGTESVCALLLVLSVNAVDGHETTSCITVFGLVTSTYILVMESRLAAAGTGIQHTLARRLCGRRWRAMKVNGTHCLMVLRGVMLGEVVSSIVSTGFPLDVKLRLSLAILEPVETHVHGFGAPLLDFLVDNTGGSLVVGDEWSARLGKAEFGESEAKRKRFGGVDERPSGFCFGG